MERKLVHEVLDYKQDIEPYSFVKLFAGVGSGKTSFVCKMITGDNERGIPRQTVLLITSRKSTVEEALQGMGKSVQSKAKAYGNLSQEVYDTGEERPFEYEEYVKIINDDENFAATITS